MEVFAATAASVVVLGWAAMWLALSAILVGFDGPQVRQEARHGNG